MPLRVGTDPDRSWMRCAAPSTMADGSDPHAAHPGPGRPGSSRGLCRDVVRSGDRSTPRGVARVVRGWEVPECARLGSSQGRRHERGYAPAGTGGPSSSRATSKRSASWVPSVRRTMCCDTPSRRTTRNRVARKGRWRKQELAVSTRPVRQRTFDSQAVLLRERLFRQSSRWTQGAVCRASLHCRSQPPGSVKT